MKNEIDQLLSQIRPAGEFEFTSLVDSTWRFRIFLKARTLLITTSILLNVSIVHSVNAPMNPNGFAGNGDACGPKMDKQLEHSLIAFAPELVQKVMDGKVSDMKDYCPSAGAKLSQKDAVRALVPIFRAMAIARSGCQAKAQDQAGGSANDPKREVGIFRVPANAVEASGACGPNSTKLDGGPVTAARLEEDSNFNLSCFVKLVAANAALAGDSFTLGPPKDSQAAGSSPGAAGAGLKTEEAAMKATALKSVPEEEKPKPDELKSSGVMWKFSDIGRDDLKKASSQSCQSSIQDYQTANYHATSDAILPPGKR